MNDEFGTMRAALAVPPSSSTWRRHLPLAGLFLAFALFLSLGAYQLSLPGLHNDEAQEAGLQAMQILAGQPAAAFRGVGVRVGDQTWPLMVQDYIGALNIYLALPFFAVGGPSPITLRLTTLAIGLATISAVYGFVNEAFGARAAVVAALLLAGQPSFLFWNRQGVFVTSITATLGMGALWGLARWARPASAARPRLGLLVGFLLGLGVYAKLLFLWIVGGVLGAALIINAAAIVRLVLLPLHRCAHHATRLPWPRSFSAREAAAAGSGFLAGLAPLIAYNLLTGGTLASVGGNLTTSYYGVDNLDIAANLATRWDEWRAVLAGRDHLWYLGGSFGNPWTEWALAAGAIVILARAAAGRQSARRGLAVLLVAGLAFLQSIFTVSGLFPTHFAILIPFAPTLIAIGMQGALAEAPAGRPAFGWLAPALVVGALAGRDAWVNVNYHRALAASGGYNVHSDAVYALSDYLASQPADTPIVAMDWGFAPQVRMLTGGRVTPNEIFGYTWQADDSFRARLSEALEEPGALFVFHFPQETIFPRREAFEAALAERGLAPHTEIFFSRRDGAPIFEVVRVVKRRPP